MKDVIEFPQESYLPDLAKSIVFHVAVILFFTIRNFYFHDEVIEVGPSIRVDMVDLPNRKALEAPAPTPAAATPTPKVNPVEAAKPSPNAKTTAKQKQNNALKQLKALENLKSQSQSKTVPLPAAIKGPRLSPGTELTGLDRLQNQEYFAIVKKHANQYWQLPDWLVNSELSAKVRVFLDASGVVLKRTLVKSSGNAQFDERVLEAVDKASPFPAPPDKFVDRLQVQGMDLGFPE